MIELDEPNPPKFEPTSANVDALFDLCSWIWNRFMPNAALCSCDGNEPSCAKALRDPRTVQQIEVVGNIVKELRDIARECDEANFANKPKQPW